MLKNYEDEGSMEGSNVKIEKLQKELLKWANAKKDYNDLANEIDRLRKHLLIASAFILIKLLIFI